MCRKEKTPFFSTQSKRICAKKEKRKKRKKEKEKEKKREGGADGLCVGHGDRYSIQKKEKKKRKRRWFTVFTSLIRPGLDSWTVACFFFLFFSSNFVV